ncbi:MAG TPA: DUF4097 family beta strand repeat-containing protein [Terriglobales bacterium]|nr:DUF4097 family beta strand repeat-containing protein [Terriglobales bacterium]
MIEKLNESAPVSRRSFSVSSLFAVYALAVSLPVFAYAEKKDFKYTVSSGASVSIVNQKGSVTVKPSTSRQVIITANPSSDKVELDASQNGNRVSVRTHMLGKAGDDARVDYDVQLPADCTITIDSGTGDVKVENVRGNVTVDSEEGQIEMRGVTNGIIQVQTVNGNVSLSNLKQARIQVTSTGGNVELSSVSGPLVSVKSTSGTIKFTGDFNGGGNYKFTNHSGDIEVSTPATASVDLSARSQRGSVESDLAMQKSDHPAFALTEGKSVAGKLNSGASSVELRSFSGKIRVKKQ